MKLTFTEEFIFKLRGGEIPASVRKPYPGTKTTSANYLLYDDHDHAPSGFAVRVGKKSATYLVDTMIGGKKMKITVGLAAGKSGSKQVMSLEVARHKAMALVLAAREQGSNPVTHAKAKRADLLTMGDVWESYLGFLSNKTVKVKPNSLKAIEKARNKLASFEGTKVADITSKEVLDLFNLHAITHGHPTAAEQMGRWATAAVQKAIELENFDALNARRESRLFHNPFHILKIAGKYRSRDQLEKAYKDKGIRNPLSLSNAVPAFFDAAWEYRKQNLLGADFLILSLLWGLRLGEACTFTWKERLPKNMHGQSRWIGLENAVACISDSKNRTDHEFPIGPCALELLKIRRMDLPADEVWVFPTASPHSKVEHYSDASVALKRVTTMANEMLKDRGHKILNLRGHDLRRTFGAACEKLGLSDRQIKRLLGHALTGGDVTNRYTVPEWHDTAKKMKTVEELMLSETSEMYDALTHNISKLISHG